MPKIKIKTQNYILFITIALFIVLFGIGSLSYAHFFSLQVFFNLFIDNASLLVIAIGMTFVLLIGGIDISVGSVIALVCMSTAALFKYTSMNAATVIFLMILLGAVFGLFQGVLISYFKMQPFIVTLGGLMLARGLTALISEDTITILNPTYVQLAGTKFFMFGTDSFIRIGVIIALVIFAISIYVLKFTKFGRNVYAVGGSEASSLLMGLPVMRTQILVYMLSSICAAIAGIIFSFNMLSGYALHGVGMEMDAIASAVIGGTMLTGGEGGVIGTLFGVLINGTIKTLIMFQGTLSSWWIRIVMAALLCVFIVLQGLLALKRKKQR